MNVVADHLAAHLLASDIPNLHCALHLLCESNSGGGADQQPKREPWPPSHAKRCLCLTGQYNALDKEVKPDGLLVLLGEVVLAEAHGHGGLANSTVAEDHHLAGWGQPLQRVLSCGQPHTLY